MFRFLPIVAASAAILAASTVSGDTVLPPASSRTVDFVRDIQPILQSTCLKCHGSEKQKGDYRLDVKSVALTEGSSHAPNIVPGHSADSPLIKFVAGLDPELKMPPKDEPLTAEQIGLLRRWIDDGAIWPDGASTTLTDKSDWWSLRPVVKRPTPPLPPGGHNAIDAWIGSTLAKNGLTPAPEANARTLIRRLYFDLTGLPPSPDEVDAFANEWASAADREPVYARLVDSLLASPRYGERWARHWLDVVHFGETHGYDKDQPRPNAWPYRDYVIRAFNRDTPYARFVQEQLAGDVLFPNTVDGITALGFIAAGPWDLIGHAEVPETKIDGKVARHLDRDDMVSNTIGTFNAMTVHCAQCHDHKFDPITAEDYYSLQSVFAALDRADRPFDEDPAVAARRTTLTSRQRALKSQLEATTAQAREKAGDTLASLDKTIAAIDQPKAPATQGWHSAMEPAQNSAKWVQADLGTSADLRRIVLRPCRDAFNQIGDGFGFPVRFKIEVSDDPEFKTGSQTVADQTSDDFANPGVAPVAFKVSLRARHLRITATSLASRKDGYMFALAELQVLDATGKDVAAGATVTSLDSIEAPGAWSRAYLVDREFPGASPVATENIPQAREHLQQARRLVLRAMLGDGPASTMEAAEKELADVDKELKSLPPARVVYAGTVHTGSGAFAGTGGSGGKPRQVTVLARGDVRKPGRDVVPGAIVGITALAARFDLPPDAPEGARRAALARWLTDAAHPLTWRTIVNRVWHYHFGRGIVDTPNDFGHMGGLPSHPELLDWLAVTFRDDFGGSLKRLHRLIVTSAAYRQQSEVANEFAIRLDSGNALLWRQNRRKLEAEAVRDSVLAVAGKLDLTMGGPSFQDFVVTHPEHSPHYEYQLADPENPVLHRRSVYRFLVRSQQQPWMAALDCADPSMMVEKRNQTITPLQALAQLNNQLMVVMARHFAERAAQAGPDVETQITVAFRLAVQRDPSPEELEPLAAYARTYGLANACRLLINLNEFTFID